LIAPCHDTQRGANASRNASAWSKTVGWLAQLKARGFDKVCAVFVFGVVAYNLVRLPQAPGSDGRSCVQ
jgi:hypothetical protein